MTTKHRNPFGLRTQEFDRLVILSDLDARPKMEDHQYDEDFEPPACSICDGLGHGYPGAGPCPLEETGEKGVPYWAQ